MQMKIQYKANCNFYVTFYYIYEHNVFNNTWSDTTQLIQTSTMLRNVLKVYGHSPVC